MLWTNLYWKAHDLAIDLLPPLVSRQVARLVTSKMPALPQRSGPAAAAGPAPGDPAVERVSTLEELDEWIRRADAAGAASDDELRRVLAAFEFAIDTKMPVDPFSEEYAAAQRELYTKITGHSQYRSVEHEQTPFEMGPAVIRSPFPYATQSTATLGEQLIRQGLLIRQLKLRPPARVIEFGPGWGNLTLELAKMNLAVTAVDVYPKFTELISERAKQLGLDIQTVTCDMLDYRTAEPFDAAIFFESFHHCSDHLQMLRNLTQIVKPDGFIAFGSEPIVPLPYPWGLRLDGMAVWSTRKFNWQENGFTPEYFTKALARTGWKAEFTFGVDAPGSVVVAYLQPV